MRFRDKHKKPSIVFVYGDVGAGKTTLLRNLIQKQEGEGVEVTSPTYTYYNRYNNLYHFDLYRLDSYDEFISIGGEEILDNNEGIIFIEWPQIIENMYEADICIHINKSLDILARDIEIEYR